MNLAKDMVLQDLHNQIAKSEKSTTSERGLIHMAAAVKAAEDGHDIHYYCRIMEEWK